MIFVKCSFFPDCKCIDICNEFVESNDLKRIISSRTGISPDVFTLCCNGRQLHSNETVSNGSSVYLTLALPGGKGGFGSMLRAIGAQIEKTTNREACRDLSGRRLRDINEEQRLKKWIAKQAEREEAAAKRKREKLERLRAAPRHDFNDSEYDKKRSELPERIFDAVSQGLQSISKVETDSRKRKSSNSNEASKKQCLWLGIDGASDLSDISEESDSESTDNNPTSSACTSDIDTNTGASNSDCDKISEQEAYGSEKSVSNSHSTDQVISSDSS